MLATKKWPSPPPKKQSLEMGVSLLDAKRFRELTPSGAALRIQRQLAAENCEEPRPWGVEVGRFSKSGLSSDPPLKV